MPPAAPAGRVVVPLSVHQVACRTQRGSDLGDLLIYALALKRQALQCGLGACIVDLFLWVSDLVRRLECEMGIAGY
jgi:hypothetical protein